MGKALFIQKTILKLKVSLPDSESIVYSKYYDVVIKDSTKLVKSMAFLKIIPPSPIAVT
jgi:hypothetical protein